MRKVLVLGLLFGTIAAINAGCTGDDDDDGHSPPDSITVSGGTAVIVGSSLQLTATAVGGDDAGDVTATSTWVSSSSAKATVSATGLVSGVAAGTTTITATHDDVTGQVVLTVSTGAAASASLTFTGSGWPHNGSNAFVRILEGGVVVDCQESAAIAGNAFSINFGAILDPGTLYTYETFADLNGDNNYENDTSDHRWTGTFTATTGTNTVTVPHANMQAALTWTNNAGCPGT